jgi:hypothetical protein
MAASTTAGGVRSRAAGARANLDASAQGRSSVRSRVVELKVGFLASIVVFGLFTACRRSVSGELREAPASSEAELELRGADGGQLRVHWTAPGNLITCRHYAEPERGDYLWIRVAETPEQDGDAGPRLDIDVCRFSAIAGPLATMPAGEHGSHCGPEPGFAIWWHEREAAFNTGPAAGLDGCSLEFDHDPSTAVLRGAFECGPLVDEQTHAELARVLGSFTCVVERVQQAP